MFSSPHLESSTGASSSSLLPIKTSFQRAPPTRSRSSSLLPINTSFTQALPAIQLDTGSDEERNMTDAENDIFGDAFRRIATTQQALPVMSPEFHHQVIKPVFWHSIPPPAKATATSPPRAITDYERPPKAASRSPPRAILDSVVEPARYPPMPVRAHILPITYDPQAVDIPAPRSRSATSRRSPSSAARVVQPEAAEPSSSSAARVVQPEATSQSGYRPQRLRNARGQFMRDPNVLTHRFQLSRRTKVAPARSARGKVRICIKGCSIDRGKKSPFDCA
jgi:hypothetical protein